MDNLELRANAMLSELKAHINSLVDRCAVLAAENAQLQVKNRELEEKLKNSHGTVLHREITDAGNPTV